MTIATIQGGSFFGEMAAMVPGPRTSRVRALTRCELFKMPGHFLRAVFRADPSLQHTIGETLSSVASARVHDTLAALVHGSKSLVIQSSLFSETEPGLEGGGLDIGSARRSMSAHVLGASG